MPHHLDSVPTANLGKAAPVELRALGAVVINAGHQARIAQAIVKGRQSQAATGPAVDHAIAHSCRQAAEMGRATGALQATLKLGSRHIAGMGDDLPEMRPGGSAAVTEGPAQWRPGANDDYR